MSADANVYIITSQAIQISTELLNNTTTRKTWARNYYCWNYYFHRTKVKYTWKVHGGHDCIWIALVTTLERQKQNKKKTRRNIPIRVIRDWIHNANVGIFASTMHNIDILYKKTIRTVLLYSYILSIFVKYVDTSRNRIITSVQRRCTF